LHGREPSGVDELGKRSCQGTVAEIAQELFAAAKELFDRWEQPGDTATDEELLPKEGGKHKAASVPNAGSVPSPKERDILPSRWPAGKMKEVEME
jgi:hypothetical protein